MITPLTINIDVWIFICTALIGVGGYTLITKQNSAQIKTLGGKVDTIGSKVDDIKTDMKIDQARVHGNFEHMNEKINRIEHDTTVTRAQGNILSEAVAEMRAKLQNIEREGRRHENN